MIAETICVRRAGTGSICDARRRIRIGGALGVADKHDRSPVIVVREVVVPRREHTCIRDRNRGRVAAQTRPGEIGQSLLAVHRCPHATHLREPCGLRLRDRDLRGLDRQISVRGGFRAHRRIHVETIHRRARRHRRRGDRGRTIGCLDGRRQTASTRIRRHAWTTQPHRRTRRFRARVARDRHRGRRRRHRRRRRRRRRATRTCTREHADNDDGHDRHHSPRTQQSSAAPHGRTLGRRGRTRRSPSRTSEGRQQGHRVVPSRTREIGRTGTAGRGDADGHRSGVRRRAPRGLPQLRCRPVHRRLVRQHLGVSVRCRRAKSSPGSELCPSVGGHHCMPPATCLVAALRRFQTLMLAMAKISVASCASSKCCAASS